MKKLAIIGFMAILAFSVVCGAWIPENPYYGSSDGIDTFTIDFARDPQSLGIISYGGDLDLTFYSDGESFGTFRAESGRWYCIPILDMGEVVVAPYQHCHTDWMVSYGKTQLPLSLDQSNSQSKFLFGDTLTGVEDFSFGIRSEFGQYGYDWTYSYLQCYSSNVKNVRIVYFDDGDTTRVVTLEPGSSIADFYELDSLYIDLYESGDTLIYGGGCK